MFTGSTIDIIWINIKCAGLLYIYELEIRMNLTVWLLWVYGCLWMQLNVSKLVNTVRVIDALPPLVWKLVNKVFFSIVHRYNGHHMNVKRHDLQYS